MMNLQEYRSAHTLPLKFSSFPLAHTEEQNRTAMSLELELAQKVRVHFAHPLALIFRTQCIERVLSVAAAQDHVVQTTVRTNVVHRKTICLQRFTSGMKHVEIKMESTSHQSHDVRCEDCRTKFGHADVIRECLCCRRSCQGWSKSAWDMDVCITVTNLTKRFMVMELSTCNSEGSCDQTCHSNFNVCLAACDSIVQHVEVHPRAVEEHMHRVCLQYGMLVMKLQ